MRRRHCPAGFARPAWPQLAQPAYLSLLGWLMAGATAQAATVQSGSMPEITMPSPMQAPSIQAAPPVAPSIRAPNMAPPPGPVADPQAVPATPNLVPRAGLSAPTLPSVAKGGSRQIDPVLQRELERLRLAAEPRSGFGSTPAAANAAWTLGLIELHRGMGPAAGALAQHWFERATRYGRQPLAYAGLAWCGIDGCGGPPNPSAAQQAITQLRPHHRGRALYLQWLLDARTQPINLRGNGPEGVSRLLLPHRDLLDQAANAGDTQAHIELGLEAVTNGDLKRARTHLQTAAPRSLAAAEDVKLIDLQLGKASQTTAQAVTEAEQLYERALRAHRGVGRPPNYAEALRLYQAAAAKGSVPARRMLGLITSRLLPDGTVNPAWMAQLARLDTSEALPQFDSRSLSTLMYRDPTPLFDLLPAMWQRALSPLPN